MTRMMAPAVYAIPKVEFTSASVVTNTTPTGRLPRCRAAGGGGRHRAGDGPVRRGDRHGSRGGAAQEPRPERTPSRTRRQWARPMTVATTSGPRPRARGRRLRRPAREQRRREAGDVHCSASAWPCTSRSPAGRTPATRWPRSRSRPTAAPASTPARHRTAKATSRRGRCSPAINSASRSDRIEVVHGDTDLVPVGGGTGAPGRCSSAAPVAPGRRSRWSSSPGSWPPSCSRPTPTTSSSTGRRVGSTSPARPPIGVDLGRAGGGRTAGRRHDVPGRAPPRSRSAPTSPSSTSTPRPARSPSSGSSPSTTPGSILNPLIVEGQRHGGLAQGHRPGAVRGVRLRRGRQPAHVEPRRLRGHLGVPSCPASSSSRWRRRPAQPARRQGHRRAGGEGGPPGGGERGGGPRATLGTPPTASPPPPRGAGDPTKGGAA